MSILTANIAIAADESFNASIQILTALNITEQSALSFPDTESKTTSQTAVVAATDAGAASFDITGEASSNIVSSIVESDLSMTQGSTTITINTFTFGGSLASDGTATTDGSGSLTGANVGATANIPANAESGTYSGALTFRVVYE